MKFVPRGRNVVQVWLGKHATSLEHYEWS